MKILIDLVFQIMKKECNIFSFYYWYYDGLRPMEDRLPGVTQMKEGFKSTRLSFGYGFRCATAGELQTQ